MSDRSSLLIEANKEKFDGSWKIQPTTFQNGYLQSVTESQLYFPVPPDKTLFLVNMLSVSSIVRGVINLEFPSQSGQTGNDKSSAFAGQMVAFMLTGLSTLGPWNTGTRSLLIYDDHLNQNIAELRNPGEFVVLMHTGTDWVVVDWYLNSALFLIPAGYPGRSYPMNKFALLSAEMVLVGGGGGGGGGGYGSTSGAGGGGGGSGQIVYLEVPNHLLDDPISPDVGVGGSGGMYSDGVTKGDGTAGDPTTITIGRDIVVTALGGNGGLGSLTTSAGSGGAAVGAAAGSGAGSFAYQTYAGQAGAAGGATTAAGASAGTASAPTPTGGGGGGGFSGSTPRSGGNGGTDSGSLIFARKALGGVADVDTSGYSKDSLLATTTMMTLALDTLLDICGSGGGGGPTQAASGGYSGGYGGAFGGGGGGGGGGSVAVSTPGYGGDGGSGCLLVLPKYKTTPLG